MKQSFFAQLIARLTSETPIFFKKIVLFGISIGALGLTLKGLDLTGVKLPFDLNAIAGYMIAVGTVSTAISKLATTDPTLQAQGGSNILVNNEPPAPGVSKEAPVSPPIPQ